ncbi:hypothetical protein SAMN05421693_1284 [Ectothiorhodospira magna]|uniref:Uncharacterized protein n=1 Tax=Ectothiorhodospira magna TaxID=867345 RepID=A0A1H9FN31_9GAMM|nr:hypothetical protein SAMN05421693_1284 [Ectothiorhodospira magna]
MRPLCNGLRPLLDYLRMPAQGRMQASIPTPRPHPCQAPTTSLVEGQLTLLPDSGVFSDIGNRHQGTHAHAQQPQRPTQWRPAQALPARGQQVHPLIDGLAQRVVPGQSATADRRTSRCRPGRARQGAGASVTRPGCRVRHIRRGAYPCDVTSPASSKGEIRLIGLALASLDGLHQRVVGGGGAGPSRSCGSVVPAAVWSASRRFQVPACRGSD